MIDDIFCKIINKELPAKIVAEDNDWLAIEDIHPQAPVHVLIIPKRHGSLLDHGEDVNLMGKLLIGAVSVAKKIGVEKTGYRLIINYGSDSQGALTEHLHIHLLGGKQLGAKIVN